MSNIEEMKQAAKDAKDAPKAEKAYNDALTSTVPAPAPAPKPETKTPPMKPKKMAGGGVTRADGCISKGHTKGRMV